jgi:hypothetical protein
MKKSSVVVAILLVTMAPFAIILPMAAPAKAWGLQTHMFMVSEAMSQITNTSWYEAYEYYAPEVLAGCTTPDQVFQDWDNHLYYPETGEHNAPTAAARWFNFTRDNFTSGNWEAGFFAVGVMTHYFSDPCIPVHTDEYWPGHAGYESDINAHLADLVLDTPSEEIISNVSQFVIDCATYSHQYYDTVYAAYADEESEALETDAEIKTLTEDCLSMAINGCLSLFYTLSQYCDAPEITITYDYVALFDYAHSNDYIDYYGEDLLTSINMTLARNHFEMKKQMSAFDVSALTDVDLLVITCALDAYSTAELAAISDWASAGNKTILLTGRGDFEEDTDTARPNQVLDAIGSHIRFNDDNVYMQGTYNLWYNDLTEVPFANETMDLTLSVTTITMYSPSSLHIMDDGLVLPVIYADTTAYQTDQIAPEPTVIYDDTEDGKNGEQIPLMAVEEIGALRVIVAGTTFFSDYDYGKSAQFNNILLLENFLDWAAGDRSTRNVPDVDEIGPRIDDVEWDPALPEPGELVNVTCTVTDPGGVLNVSLVYNSVSINMTPIGGDVYEAQIPSISDGSLDIGVLAYDNDENSAIRESYTVTWVEPASTTPTTQIDPGLPPIDPMLFVMVGVAAVVIVLLVVFVLKKR